MVEELPKNMIKVEETKSWLAKLRGQITPEWIAALPQRLITVTLWLAVGSVGAASNYLVRIANGGSMPVIANGVMYSPMGKVAFLYLGDWILIPLGAKELILSPGDVLLITAFIGIIATMVANRRQNVEVTAK